MRTAVIGSGVIGVAAAIRLRQEGHDVTVFDRLDPGGACSFGNSGAMPRFQVLPMSTPGILYQVPGYLLNPLGPLAIRAAYLPKLLPWLAKFVMAGRHSAFARHFSTLSALARVGYDHWTDLLRDAGLSSEVCENSALTIYRTPAKRDKARWLWTRYAELGANIKFVERDEMRDLEPAVPDGYACGVVGSEYRHARDPHTLVVKLSAHLREQGGELRRANVADIRVDATRSVVITTDRSQETFDRVIIAAGSWSNELLGSLGVRVPLEAGRGYHMTFSEFSPVPRHVLIISDMRMALTPMSCGLRLGGSIEFAGVRAAPDFNRTTAQLENLRRLYPMANTAKHTKWSGDRPMTPDSLPVIDRCPGHPEVICAFGHGQYGLTLAAITARLVADLVADRKPAVDLAPLRCDRPF